MDLIFLAYHELKLTFEKVLRIWQPTRPTTALDLVGQLSLH